MTTTHNATQTEQQPKPTQPAVPAYLGELLARAADLFSARWPEVFVEFPWWEEGREIRYTARMEWRFSMKGPRVSVFDGRSGLFVCQSLEGLPYEIAMHAWEQRRKHKGPDGRH